MLCGHCGSEVKDGFTTCASCGATYAKRAGVVARILYSLSAFPILVSIFMMTAASKGDPDAVRIVATFLVLSALGFGLGYLASPRRWWR